MPDGDFTLSDIKAVADWHPSGQGAVRLAHRPITFSIVINTLRKIAAFRARVSISLKPSRHKVSLYPIITPDRIASIRPASIPEHATSALRAEAARLRFQLSEPGVAVVPSRLELVPKNKESGDALEMFESMARAADVTVYLPRATLSSARLDLLCRVSHDWAPAPSLSDVATLYLGQGGKVLSQAGPSTANPPGAESPPSYDELAPTPPPGAPLSPITKKRRLDDETAASQTSAIEDTCRRIFEEQREELARNMEAALRQQLHEEMRQGKQKQLELLRGELDAKIAQSKEEMKKELETSILATLDERLDGKLERLRDELYKELEQVKDEAYDDKQDAIHQADELIHFRLDERITDVKVELTDWADEEVRRIEEETWRRLSEATWTMDSL
ncbi:hypothetical protein GTA08_BOTSDO13158 [Botryosphaeria dothidea]|uniref:Uncharacterized protein n=1 Tax=Botryosphaeria dothidea TaxID=55169 RepID=A0A8H4N6X8_9PEZI|nr:hypothetical protein GTA08_BOTSDO13158 [Botryosphaeria dothidea]